MKLFTATAAAALLLSGAALANDSGTMDSILKNKLEVSSAAGAYFVTFAEDGTYTTSTETSGTWETADGELCVERSTGEASCLPLPEGKALGDSWETENAAGEPVTVKIVAAS